ncbi:MAG: LptE family protein [Bacteroidales bacterium]
MIWSKTIIYKLVLAQGIILALSASCTFKYSFSGASISPDAKTFSVQHFSNLAPLVNPTLSPNFTEALKMKFLTGTRLHQVDYDGDFAFEGQITGYGVVPQAITAGEIAAQNRLTISVRVKFVNKIDAAQSFDKSFSQFEDYDSQRSLAEVEPELVDIVVEKLMEDIFNAAATNW